MALKKCIFWREFSLYYKIYLSKKEKILLYSSNFSWDSPAAAWVGHQTGNSMKVQFVTNFWSWNIFQDCNNKIYLFLRKYKFHLSLTALISLSRLCCSCNCASIFSQKCPKFCKLNGLYSEWLWKKGAFKFCSFFYEKVVIQEGSIVRRFLSKVCKTYSISRLVISTNAKQECQNTLTFSGMSKHTDILIALRILVLLSRGDGYLITIDWLLSSPPILFGFFFLLHKYIWIDK